jgi:hypothetical protein
MVYRPDPEVDLVMEGREEGAAIHHEEATAHLEVVEEEDHGEARILNSGEAVILMVAAVITTGKVGAVQWRLELVLEWLQVL